MGITIGHERIQFAIGKRGFINGKPCAYILREQQLFISMFQLVPFTESAKDLLVLLFKGVSVDMIEILKRTAGHWGCLHTFLLKKPRTPWSNVCL